MTLQTHLEIDTVPENFWGRSGFFLGGGGFVQECVCECVCGASVCVCVCECVCGASVCVVSVCMFGVCCEWVCGAAVCVCVSVCVCVM